MISNGSGISPEEGVGSGAIGSDGLRGGSGGGGAILPTENLFFGVLAGTENNFQDSSGTTPAAVDNVIGSAGGFGSSTWDNVTQSTTANKPILRNDGTRDYFECDGLNDRLFHESGAQGTTTGQPFSFVFAAELDFSVRSNNDLFGSSSGLCFLRVNPTAISVGGINSAVGGQSFSTGDKVIISVQRGVTGVAGRVTIRLNGSQIWSAGGSTVSSIARYFLLSSNAGANNFTGKFYGGLIYEGDPSAEQIAEREQYLNDQYSLGVL